MSKEPINEAKKAPKPAGAPKIVNPYAKRKKAAPKQTSETSKNGASQQAKGRRESPALNPVEIGVSATFSQAFASVEDTSHFRSEQASMKQQRGGGRGNPTVDETRAAQRAFDESAAAEAQNSGPLSDRDHHALMQPHVLYVSTKQRGNGILKHIRNVPFAFSPMTPDYIMNTSRCALFLSCKYHSLHPTYIHRRISELKNDFTLRVLLLLVDVEDNANTLNVLNKLAVANNMTLILAWSEEEAARYLETYKAFDGKDASSIQRREQTNFVDQAADVLTSARAVNKTDAASLLSQFSSLKAVVAASMDELGLCNGMGDVKVRALYDAFHKPFSSQRAKRRKEEKEATATVGGDDEDSIKPADTDVVGGAEEDAENVVHDKEPPDDETENGM